MRVMKTAGGVLIAASLLIAVACTTTDTRDGPSLTLSASPKYRVDPFWPKALQGNWMLGQVAWVAVDSRDHVWIIHRPASILDEEKGALNAGVNARQAPRPAGRFAGALFQP